MTYPTATIEQHIHQWIARGSYNRSDAQKILGATLEQCKEFEATAPKPRKKVEPPKKVEQPPKFFGIQRKPAKFTSQYHREAYEAWSHEED